MHHLILPEVREARIVPTEERGFVGLGAVELAAEKRAEDERIADQQRSAGDQSTTQQRQQTVTNEPKQHDAPPRKQMSGSSQGVRKGERTGRDGDDL